MNVTPGSWWIDSRGQRMAVGNPRIFRPLSGTSPHRLPCFLEGVGLNIIWLTSAEIRGGFKLFRPSPCFDKPPLWLLREDATSFRDVLLDVPPNTLRGDGSVSSKPLWLARAEIKYGWIRLTGLTERIRVRITLSREDESWHEKHYRATTDTIMPFCWSVQRYDTLFLPLSEAIPRLKPRFNRLTSWDKIDVGIDVAESPDRPVCMPIRILEEDEIC